MLDNNLLATDKIEIREDVRNSVPLFMLFRWTKLFLSFG
jgi:hypothetical protein